MFLGRDSPLNRNCIRQAVIACTLALAATLLVIVETTSSAYAATTNVRVVRQNVGKMQGAIDNALAKADSTKAHGIALQEVCDHQLAALKAAKSGVWTIASVRGGIPLNYCPPGEHVNDVAIWTGGTTGSRAYYGNGDPEGNPNAPITPLGPSSEGGNMVCVRFNKSTAGSQTVPVHICSVHLNPATGGAQTAAIRTIVKSEWFGGTKNHFGVIAGDFNGKPDEGQMDRMYDPAYGAGADGDFTEYNRTQGFPSRHGTWTAKNKDGTNVRKIDYIFFSTNRVAPRGLNTFSLNAPSGSNHRLLYSVAAMSY